MMTPRWPLFSRFMWMFCCSDPGVPGDQCTIAPQCAHVPGDNGCLRTSGTTGERHKHGTPRGPVVPAFRATSSRSAGG